MIMILNGRRTFIFEPRQAIKTIIGNIPEQFKGERAVRLFQLQTWILFPDRSNKDDILMVRAAAMIAAAKMLERIEDDIFDDEKDAHDHRGEPFVENLPPQTLQRLNKLLNLAEYRGIHDGVFAENGGLLQLLNIPSQEEFDRRVAERTTRTAAIGSLLDYRIRAILHGGDVSGQLANESHAYFFCWWPTYSIPGKRGKTVAGKAPSPKTMRSWWNRLEESAAFLYLEQIGFDQFLPTETSDDSFLPKLFSAAADREELASFFSHYASIIELFKRAGIALPSVSIPDSVPRLLVSRPPFTSQELAVIAEYEANYLKMND
jgi:hypothetical protein